MTVSGDQQTRGSGFRRSADQGTNIRLRLRCSFRLFSFGYVLNDDLRLTQPIRAAHPFDEILLYNCRGRSTNQLFYAKQTQFQKKSNDVYPYNTKDYERKRNWTLSENKPNSNPIKPNLQKDKMNISYVKTTNYEQKTMNYANNKQTQFPKG